MTRLLLYSKEIILAKGLESVLRQVEGFELLPLCSTLGAVKEEMTRSTPDVMLLDLGPEVTFAVLSEMKQTVNAKIVLWVNSISTELAFQAMGLGIRGILRKTLAPELQVKCLQKVHAGELWFERTLVDNFVSVRRVALSRREGQLVQLLAQGLKNKEIATFLSVSENTVKVYLSRLFQKVGAKDRFELALFGLKNLSIGQGAGMETGHEGDGARTCLRSLVVDKPAERVGMAAQLPDPLRSPAL